MIVRDPNRNGNSLAALAQTPPWAACGKNLRRIQPVHATVSNVWVGQKDAVKTEDVARKCLSAEQRAELWRRWQAGELITRIASALDRPYNTVHQQISNHGGCAPYRLPEFARMPP